MLIQYLPCRRTKNLITNRSDLIRQRRETAIKTKLQKDAINKVMEQVRTDAGKANRIIKMVMSGQGTIAQLTSASPSPTRGRSNSEKRTKSKSPTTSQFGHTAPANPNRHSQSAGAADFQRMAADGGSGGHFRKTDPQPAPQAYISPYETAPGAL
jgi:hypothetical protein